MRTEVTDYPWQAALWQQFVALHAGNRMPHALLLTGVKGLGKLDFAQRMAAGLLCQQSESVHACGQCHSCQLLLAGNHPDHVVLAPDEAGRQIRIDQIRDLKEKQTLMPKVSDWKTVIITEADRMNIPAFNSLLKLLEEPQPQSVLILISEQPRQLPITIRSRCQALVMPVPPTEQATDWLERQQPGRDPKQWQALLRLCRGAPLAALAAPDEGLAQLQHVRADFASLMRCEANPVQLSTRWQQFELASVLYQCQDMVQLKLRSLLVEGRMLSTAVMKQYWAIADCITDTLKLISSQNNLNKALLIEDFMVTVMQHAGRIRQLEGAHR